MKYLYLQNNAAVDLLDVDGNLAVDLATKSSNLKATMKLHMVQKQKMDESLFLNFCKDLANASDFYLFKKSSNPLSI